MNHRLVAVQDGPEELEVLENCRDPWQAILADLIGGNARWHWLIIFRCLSDGVRERVTKFLTNRRHFGLVMMSPVLGGGQIVADQMRTGYTEAMASKSKVFVIGDAEAD